MRRGLLVVFLAFLLAAAPRIARFAGAYFLALDLLAPGLRPALQSIRFSEISVGGGAAELYRPAGPSCGGLVSVHGLSRPGRSHPFFQRLGRALAREGFVVLAPDLPRLRAFQLAESDVGAVVEAVKTVAGLTPGPIGILGFSFGAGPGLLAAADPRVRDRVALVGSFGGYWDLREVMVFITTGWYEEDGEWRLARQQEYNRWKLLAAMTPLVTDGEERRRLARIVERKLADPGSDVAEEASRLRGEGRAVLALVENRERDRVPALMAELPVSVRSELRRLSPVSVIGQVSARLLVAHGAGDDSIPYVQSIRLARAAPVLGRLVIFEGLGHALPSEVGWSERFRLALDGQRLVSLLDDLLELCQRG